MPMSGKTNADPPSRGEWAENWPLMLSCLFGVAVPMAAIYAFGQFLGPIEREFGWSRTQASVGLSASLLLGFLAGPIVGRLVDRYNARWLVLTGVPLVGIALASFALTSGNTALWTALWCLHALAGALISPAVWIAVISSAFEKHRHLAIATVLCGSGIASGLAPSSARLLIDAYGWRTAYVLFALLWTIPNLILAAVFFFDRRQRSIPAPEASGPASSQAPSTLRKTIVSGNFIKLALAVIATQSSLSAYMIHLSPALADKGLDFTRAAAVAGLAGLAAIPGKLGIGYLFDRAGQAKVAIGVMVLMALASMMLAIDSASLILAVVASCLLGLSAGAMMAFIACLCRRLFEPSIFGTVYGAMISFSALAAAFGPLAASTAHDMQGSYAWAFWLGIAIAAVSALLLASLTRPGDIPDPAGADSPSSR